MIDGELWHIAECVVIEEQGLKMVLVYMQAQKWPGLGPAYGPLARYVNLRVPGIPGACATRNFTYLARGPWNIVRMVKSFTGYVISARTNNTPWLGIFVAWGIDVKMDKSDSVVRSPKDNKSTGCCVRLNSKLCHHLLISIMGWKSQSLFELV